MKYSIPGLEKFRLGTLIHFHENDWYVKVPGSKTESLLPKWYVKTYLKRPRVGDRVLCYVANAINSLGYTHVNQERLLYLLNLLRLQRLAKQGATLEAEICKFRYGGYVVRLLPHMTSKLNYFYAFLPLSFTPYYGSQVEGRLTQVKVKNFNYEARSIVVQGVANMNTFVDLTVGDLVDALVLQINPGSINFLVGDYQATLPYGMIFFNSKLPHDFDVRANFKENSIVEDLQIIKKDLITNKLILSAAHLFDKVENYFPNNSPMKSKILQTHPKFYVVRTESGVVGTVALSELSWKNKLYHKFKKQTYLKVTFLKSQYSKVAFTCKTDEHNFWPQVKTQVPLFQPVRSNFLFGKLGSYKFLGDSENYLYRVSTKDYVHYTLLLWFFKNNRKLERGEMYDLIPLSYNEDKGYIECILKEIYLAYALLKVDRTQIHQAKVTKLTDKSLHLTSTSVPYPFTFSLIPNSVDDNFNYKVGSIVNFKVSKFNLTTSKVAEFTLV